MFLVKPNKHYIDIKYACFYFQVFTVPLEERRYREMNEHSFGDETKQAETCKDIMAKNSKLPTKLQNYIKKVESP